MSEFNNRIREVQEKIKENIDALAVRGFTIERLQAEYGPIVPFRRVCNNPNPPLESLDTKTGRTKD
jgi:hypothetical protein